MLNLMLILVAIFAVLALTLVFLCAEAIVHEHARKRTRKAFFDNINP